MKQTIYQFILTITILMASFFYSNAQIMDTTIIFKHDKNKKMPALDSIELIGKHDKVIVDADSNILYIRKKYKSGTILSISNNGFKIGDGLKKKKKKHKKLHVGMHFDFGFNNVIDNTNYADIDQDLVLNEHTNTISTASRKLNSQDLNLITGKSINFNFWPLLFSQDLKTRKFQIESGLGFQFFNYRYHSAVRHTDIFEAGNQFNPGTQSTFDNSLIFTEESNTQALSGKEKNKLGISYVSIPLMLRYNSAKKINQHGLSVAFGVIGSYKLKSWTKFYGQKQGGDFDIRTWMTQLTAEVGIPGILKLYGTYSLKPMYNNEYLNHTPIAIGIRL